MDHTNISVMPLWMLFGLVSGYSGGFISPPHVWAVTLLVCYMILVLLTR